MDNFDVIPMAVALRKSFFLNNVLPKTSFGSPQVRTMNLPLWLWGYRVQCFGDVALSCGQGVDITIPVTCSVFEPDPMTSQCTRGVPRLKFGHKIHEMCFFQFCGDSFTKVVSQGRETPLLLHITWCHPWSRWRHRSKWFGRMAIPVL